MTPKLIGFGHKLQQGKDLAIQNIKDAYGHKFDIVKIGFGDMARKELPTKNSADWHKDIGSHLGNAPFLLRKKYLSPDNADFYALEVNDTDYRTALQWWGQVRVAQNERYWINKIWNYIQEQQPDIACISGIRMKHEVGWLRYHGGVYIKVTREGWTNPNPEHAKHKTECDLDGVAPDYALRTKDGDTEGAAKAAQVLFKRIMKEKWQVEVGAPLE